MRRACAIPVPNGVVLKGPADSEEYVYCSLVDKPIGIRVTECNRYTDRGLAPLWAMKEIAGVLQVDSKRQKIGFLSAKEWQRLNEDESVVPGHRPTVESLTSNQRCGSAVAGYRLDNRPAAIYLSASKFLYPRGQRSLTVAVLKKRARVSFVTEPRP